MKPSVPKVVITTGKPKPPVIISKSKEGITTKQEQVSITHEKVTSTIYNHVWFCYPPFFTNLTCPSKNTNCTPTAHFFEDLFHLQTSKTTIN